MVDCIDKLSHLTIQIARMSTLTSSDLNVKRSTTRVHAPPGGVSTISFGNWNEVPASPAKKPVANGEAKPDVAATVAKLALEGIQYRIYVGHLW